jgi:single-strand DNA-binding protein
VTTLGLAVNEKYKDKEEVLFVDVTVWGKNAETCAEYLHKGSPVFVEGKLKLNTWEQDGQKRSKIDVTALSVQFLPSGERVNSTEKKTYPAEEEFNNPVNDDDVPF